MSHIKNIEIKNFKSIRHAVIEDCRRVNVFIGYPNVGKSNILEALGLFSISEESRKFTDYVRMGKATTLFFDGNVDEAVEVILNDFYRAKLSHVSFGFTGSFQIDRFREGFRHIEIEIKNSNLPPLSDVEGKLYALGKFDVNEVDLEVKNFSGNGNLRVYQEQTQDFLQSSRYRKIPILRYEFKQSISYDSKQTWRLKEPYGQNLFEIISTKNDLNEEVIQLFKGYNLNFLYDSGSQEYKILKIIGNKIFSVPYSMTAETLQRLIFHKAAIASNKDSVLLFEEPEAHMFPPYIAKFTADVMFDKNNNQFFIATHSPFVLNDFMEDLDKADLSIYAVGYNKDKGETTIQRLTDQQVTDIYQYGVDLFFNLEDFLKDVVS